MESKSWVVELLLKCAEILELDRDAMLRAAQEAAGNITIGAQENEKSKQEER